MERNVKFDFKSVNKVIQIIEATKHFTLSYKNIIVRIFDTN